MNETEKLKAYRSPKWQANDFLWIYYPIELIGGLSIEEIAEEFGVSRQAASIQLKQIK